MADIQRAIEIAVSAHKGQEQRNGLPYVLHPLKLVFAYLLFSSFPHFGQDSYPHC